MKIDLDELRATATARVQAALSRRAHHVHRLSPRAAVTRLRGITIARVLPWRRKDPPDAA